MVLIEYIAVRVLLSRLEGLAKRTRAGCESLIQKSFGEQPIIAPLST